MSIQIRFTGLVLIAFCCVCSAFSAENWIVDTTDNWKNAEKISKGLSYDNGFAVPEGETAAYKSVVRKFDKKRQLKSVTFKQNPQWLNWSPVKSVGPTNLGDAQVFLCMGPKNYWMFGLYHGKKKKAGFEAEDAKLEGFDIPLKTTPFPNQFDAPGGLEKGLGGYHAWQSRDMVNWVHHGAVTEQFSRWVTSAEYVDGKVYIYYDYPNDQDPHLYIDEDLTDGKPGKNMGIAFKDPSHGSDAGFIRDLQGRFHVIYEDWSPINARKHSWDSPLAGHAVSPNGINQFKILPPVVDKRTKPTGKIGQYPHPHWDKVPGWENKGTGKYEIHEPEQNAYGDWAPFCVGGQYYLFCDFDPAGERIRVGLFTSPSLDQEFEFCGSIGSGHPDPDIGFAEGKFYLFTQTRNDYISPGPWVEQVQARAGVDTDNDGDIDAWTDWQQVKESYDYIEGFAKQIASTPATLDVSRLPAGFGFSFQFRTKTARENQVKPVMDSVKLCFE